MLPHKQIELKLQAAVRAILPEADTSIVLVRPCPDPKFGDYQSNALMSLAKARKMNPRQLATDVVAKLDVGDWCEKVEIAGAGFLNFRLKQSVLTQTLEAAARSELLFFEKVGGGEPCVHADRQVSPTVRTVVIDFSSPNVAKPMHVGHIRSTILGDCLARTLHLLGHRVITDNHIGDWGTQFGKLLVGWKRETEKDKVAFRTRLLANPIGEMEQLYKTQLSRGRKLKKLTSEEEAAAFVEEAREELVKLQSGDAENLEIWREMIALSQKQFDEIYSRLGVKFDYSWGESFYNDRLAPLVDELMAKGLARESEGAIAIFFDDIPQLKERPALVRKNDGGFNYATTDLATLAYRLETWHPDEIIYVTDGRQQLHFQQVFTAFRKWMEGTPSSVPQNSGQRQSAALQVKLAHVWFGSILGEDGKPFKTRSGETVKLADLLDEAEERALKIVSEKNPDLPEAQRREIARVVGLGAVKYADLLPNRQSDYVFSWDKMLALQGNTAPYLQYAYTRIKSIFRKSDVASALRADGSAHCTDSTTLVLSAPEEIALAKHLLNFGLTLEAVAEEYRPNFLCNYLYELAGKFTSFYENCPVLKADDATRASRLVLCALTARVLKQGLETLGIETVEQM